MKKINIEIDSVIIEAELFDTPTANKIYNILPFEGELSFWGNEIYFTIPVEADLEDDAREEVEIGDLAFWPVGQAFCIFYGQTPLSNGPKPRAYSPVNVFGKVLDNPEVFKKQLTSTKIKITTVK